MLCLDTELTGLDLWHGCLPYSVQICNDQGKTWYWNWPVNPYSRIPAIQEKDLLEILALLQEDELVGQNIKIDLLALHMAAEHLKLDWQFEWQWESIHDTLIKAHVFRNLWPHGLKDMREVFFGVSRKNQTLLKLATHEARTICKKKPFIEKHGVWRIADANDIHWPAVSRAPSEPDDEIEGWWLLDTWLPKAIVDHAPEFLPDENDWDTDSNYFHHPWESVSETYGAEDALTTLVLNEVLDYALKEEGLTEISQRRHRLLQITWEMEHAGLHILGKKNKTETHRYRLDSERQKTRVVEIATEAGMEDFNPASGPQLQTLLYKKWNFPILARTEPSKKHPQGQPSTSAAIIEKLKASVEEDPEGAIEKVEFFECLIGSKRAEKASSTLESYWLWSIPGNRSLRNKQSIPGIWVHPKLNITGTKFTRQSCNDPNLMNVSTGKEVEGDEGTTEIDFALRSTFGPPPGREWLSIDLQSVEFLVWGFSSGAKVIEEVFNKGEPLFKPFMEAIHNYFDKESKAYKRTKNGIYSKIYGSSDKNADRTFGVEGATSKINARIPEIKAYAKKKQREVQEKGYIITRGGAQLWVESDEPHKAVSADVQGHAGWVIGEAMIACHEYLSAHPEIEIIMQIHDELIFEGPVGFHQVHGDPLAKCISLAGVKFGIPTPVNKSLITDNWANAKPLT